MFFICSYFLNSKNLLLPFLLNFLYINSFNVFKRLMLKVASVGKKSWRDEKVVRIDNFLTLFSAARMQESGLIAFKRSDESSTCPRPNRLLIMTLPCKQPFGWILLNCSEFIFQDTLVDTPHSANMIYRLSLSCAIASYRRKKLSYSDFLNFTQ